MRRHLVLLLFILSTTSHSFVPLYSSTTTTRYYTQLNESILGRIKGVFKKKEEEPPPSEDDDDGWIRGTFKKMSSRFYKKIEEEEEIAKGKEKLEIKKKEPPKAKTKDTKDTTNTSSSYSPLSVVQKFLTRKEQWVNVFSKTKISPGELVPAKINDVDLLVVASKDGRKLYCLKNSCPHLGTPLETGQLVRLPNPKPTTTKVSSSPLTELEMTDILQQDGCEDCIVCPLHRTAFALESGQVRGEWCPYPPIIGKVMGTVKEPTPVEVFPLRIRGKNIQVNILANDDTTNN